MLSRRNLSRDMKRLTIRANNLHKLFIALRMPTDSYGTIFVDPSKSDIHQLFIELYFLQKGHYRCSMKHYLCCHMCIPLPLFGSYENLASDIFCPIPASQRSLRRTLHGLLPSNSRQIFIYATDRTFLMASCFRFSAAFRSRSWFAPQFWQVHSRTDKSFISVF